MADSRSPSPADPSRDISLHSDPGLQPERTTLAWTRTVVAMLVVGAVMLRWAHLYGSAVVLVAGVLCMLAIFIVATQRRRYQAGCQGIVRGRAAPNVRSVVALTGSLLLLGAAGLVFVLADALG